MSINRYTSFRDLACADTSGMVAYDVVTGDTSSAVGIVWSITDNSKLTVINISGTFVSEDITNQDSDTATITGNVASTETTPSNVVVVEGIQSVDSTADTNEAIDISETGIDTTDGTQFSVDDVIVIDSEAMLVTAISTNTLTVVRGYDGTTAATHTTATDIYTMHTDVFRQIRNASNTGGWGLHTDPTSTDQTLYLDALIFFGRRDQTGITYYISELECVDTLTDDSLNEIINTDNISYKTLGRTGRPHYTDEDETNWPPFWCEKTVRMTFPRFRFLDNSEYRAFCTVWIGDSTRADGIGQLVMNGKTLFSRCSSEYTYYHSFTQTIASKVHKTTFASNLIFTSNLVDFIDTSFMNFISWIIFINADSSESTLKDIQLLSSNGELDTDTFGGLFSATTKHIINCKFKNVVTFSLAALIIIFDEKTFDLKVVDNKTNYAIENANVRLLDKNEYSALFEDTGETVDSTMTDSQTTIDVSDYTQFSDGDVIRIDTEKMEITDASSNPMDVTRGVQGTTARSHTQVPRIIWRQQENIQTDSNGDITQKEIVANINYNGSTLTGFNPFRLIISKSGFKTVDMPLEFGDGTANSYKTDFQKLVIKLDKGFDLSATNLVNLEQ